MIIDGKKISEEIISKLSELPKPGKFLAVVLVGNDPASVSFIKKKKELAEKLGLDFRLYQVPDSIKNDDLRVKVRIISKHKTCGGVIVQLPLPSHINREYILNVIPPEKDIDVLGRRAIEEFYVREEIAPPPVGVFKEIVDRQGIDLKSSSVTVFGVGYLIGKPILKFVSNKAKEVFLIDKEDDRSPLGRSDVVVLGAGVPGVVKVEDLKEGCLVLDFGTTLVEGKLKGDLLVSPGKNISYTPTPGGTGPVLVAKLFENFFKLVDKQKTA